MLAQKLIKDKGFTLIEMVMVLVIIGLLAAIVVPQFSVQMDDAKEVQTRANLDNLRTAISIYSRKMNGIYPSTLADLAVTTPTIPVPILKTVPEEDAWGIPFTYAPATGEVSCSVSNPKCITTW